MFQILVRGEKVIKPKVAKYIDNILEENKKPTKTILVSVYEHEQNVA